MNVVVDHVTKTIHGAVVLQDISLNFESDDRESRIY